LAIEPRPLGIGERFGETQHDAGDRRLVDELGVLA
jgi:hypothetical protein